MSVINKPQRETRSQGLIYQYIDIHPCVINKKAYIVYPRGLEQQSPGIFNELKKRYTSKGYLLKEDQRSQTLTNSAFIERRGKWLPMLFMTLSLFCDNEVNATTVTKTTDAVFNNSQAQQVELRLIASQKKGYLNYKSSTINISRNKQVLHTATSSKLYTILSSHYKKQNSDPAYIMNDLKEMANYYSHFPQAVLLITSLNKKQWHLAFDKNTWSTIAKGTKLQVHEAVIHFNTRSAAKLKLHNVCTDNPVCIASPADALLHEMLHTQSMLIYKAEFIRQGGMNGQMYPIQHEYAIIQKEKALYASMSRTDKRKRPLRNEHIGRKISASCATCIK